MSVTLMNPKNLEDISHIVESTDLGVAMQEFIQSLDLPDDEEEIVIDSVGGLPSAGLRPSALPKSSPSLIRMEWWK